MEGSGNTEWTYESFVSKSLCDIEVIPQYAFFWVLDKFSLLKVEKCVFCLGICTRICLLSSMAYCTTFNI